MPFFAKSSRYSVKSVRSSVSNSPKDLDDKVDKLDIQSLSSKGLHNVAVPPEIKSPFENGESTSSSPKVSNKCTVGKLSEEWLPSKVIIWQIPNFFALPKERDFWIRSPEFSIANATWILQVFPNGQREQDTDGTIDLLLLRLHSKDSQHLVWYNLGIKTIYDSVYESFSDFCIFKDKDVEWGVAHLLEQSKALDDMNMITEDGNVTVFCEMQVLEKEACKFSEGPKLTTNSFSFKVPEQLPVGELSEKTFPTGEISWCIPIVLISLEERGFEISSPLFQYENATWCLQMHLLKEQVDGKDVFGLKLIRLHCSSLMQEVVYTLGIKNRFGKTYDSFKRKYTFHGNAVKYWDVCLLKQSTSDKYSILSANGFITIFCRLCLKEPCVNLFSQDEALDSDLKCYTIETGEQQLYHQSNLSGEEYLTWKIANFFELPEDTNFFIDSSEFCFAEARWCLRLYPNGKVGDSRGWVHLLLRKLHSGNSAFQICYRLGLLTRLNTQHGNLNHVVSVPEDTFEVGLLDLVNRSEFIQNRNKFIQNDILTVFCQISVIKKEEICNSSEVSDSSLKANSAIILKQSQPLCSPYVLTYKDTFKWEITNFITLPMDEDYYIDSEEFSVADASWCLRMYPNGQKGISYGYIHLSLVRLHSCSLLYHRYIHYRLGLKKGKNTEYGGLTHVAIIHANSVEIGGINLMKRSDLKSKKKFTLNGSIVMIEGVTATSAEKELSKTPGDLSTDAVVDLKQDKNTISLEESENFCQKVLSKDEVNILADEKVAHGITKELNFDSGKKEKETLTKVEEGHPFEEIRDKANLDFASEKISTLKLNEKDVFCLKECKSNSEDTGLKDDRDAATDEKVDDIFDITLRKKKKKKKSLNYDQLVKECLNKAKNDIAKRDEDFVMEEKGDLKMKEKNIFCDEELENNSQEMDLNKNGSTATDKKDDEIFDDLDISVFKKKKKKQHSDQLAECSNETRKEETQMVADENQHCSRTEFDCGKESDVRFFVKGEEFRVCSAILNDQCTFFASLSNSDIESSSLVVINNSDLDIFATFIRYLYTGNTEILNTEKACKLYSVARKYGALKLKTECAEYIRTALSIDTICDILAFSFKEEENELVELATSFFSKNVKEITTTLKWRLFLREHFTAAYEFLVKLGKK